MLFFSTLLEFVSTFVIPHWIAITLNVGIINSLLCLKFKSYKYLIILSLTAGEDKMVKCWDLEYNKVVRHYHGHLSGVFALSLHPILDLLISGGRDSVARVWDMRTKNQVHVLGGHTSTVSSILTAGVDPQVPSFPLLPSPPSPSSLHPLLPLSSSPLPDSIPFFTLNMAAWRTIGLRTFRKNIRRERFVRHYVRSRDSNIFIEHGLCHH